MSLFAGLPYAYVNFLTDPGNGASALSPAPSPASPEPVEEPLFSTCGTEADPPLDFVWTLPLELSRLSLDELEQVHLWLQQQRIEIQIGGAEERLGEHVHQCVEITTLLTGLQNRIREIKERQEVVSNGMSRRRPLYYYEQMERLSNLFFTSQNSRIHYRLHQPPIPPLGQIFRRIGALFYGVPSLATEYFTREWNYILRSAQRTLNLQLSNGVIAADDVTTTNVN